MKTLRRLLSSLLCLLLCAALLPAAAAEGAADNAVIASGSCGESARWTLSSEGVLSISGTGKMSWNGSCPWGDYRTDVKSVVIGSGITSILGFDQCPNLKSVTIPASVTELRDSCFAGSGVLKSVELPSGIVAIPGNCFCGCASLTNVTIPSGVKSIGMYAFAFCGSLTGLTLPSGLQIIGEAAFTGSGALTGLTIPSKVTQIGQRAFLDCGALSAIKVSSYNQNYSASNGVLFNKDKSILIAYPGGKSGDYSFPGTVSSICPFAFAGCRKLGHITVSSKVGAIPESCFDQACLTGITLPGSLKTIGEGAFQMCEGLSVVTFPASLQSIGDWAFWECSSIRELRFCGPAPDIGDCALYSVGEYGERVTAFYPASAAGWAEAIAAVGEENIDWLPCVKPSVKTQPKSQTVNEGNTAKFSVSATGEGLSYQWQYRTSKTGSWYNSTLSGAKTMTVSVPATAARNGFQYRCIVSSVAGSAYSDTATLTVYLKPIITTQPKSTSAAGDTTVQFFIAADGAESYQWEYRTSSKGTWRSSTMAGAKSTVLSVPAIAGRNGFQYRCKVTNAAGTVCSAVAVLTVCTNPVITAQPVNKAVNEGATATFTVTAAGEDLKYQWQYRTSDSGPWYISSMPGFDTMTISVPATKARNGFQYRCKVSNVVGKVYSDISTLTVKPKPVIIDQPASTSVKEGKTALFFVEAAGATSYQWQYRTSSTGNWYVSGLPDARSSTLSVPATAARNGFQYRCKISNEAGYVYTNHVTLTVKLKPVITSQSTSKTVYVGATVQFSVTATGEMLYYQWQYRTADTGIWYISKMTGANTAVVVVPATAARNGFQYRCKVWNEGGEAFTEPMTLYVLQGE